MHEHKTIEMNRRSWDTISAHYQASTHISTDDVHYSTLAPGERELGLLGDGSAESLRSVTGKRVIEIGCGGGQNSIALSKWGATCIGIDPSPAQIAHARRLAIENGVEVQFVEGIAEDLSAFPDGSFDIALSSYAFDYVTDLRRAYDEAWRVLRSPDPTSGKPQEACSSFASATPGSRLWAGTCPATRTRPRSGTMLPGLMCKNLTGPTATAPRPGCGTTCAPWNRSSTS